MSSVSASHPVCLEADQRQAYVRMQQNVHQVLHNSSSRNNLGSPCSCCCACVPHRHSSH